MANQLNSAQGMDLKALKTGQVVLTKVIRTSNPDIVSLELYEGGIVNTSRASVANTEGQYEGLGMMMSGYKGFTNSGSVTVAWQNITVSNLELMLGVEELDIDNGIWQEFRTKAGKTKEMLELVKQGKVDPIPVSKRDIKEATQTLDDLRDGSITGRVVLQP